MLDIKRVTAKDDLKKLVLDIRKARWVQASEISPEDYSVEDLNKYLIQAASVFVVAYKEQQFGGMASAKILHKPNGDIWLYIDEVDVCENFQKQGVGKEIMNYLLTFAQDSDCEEVWLGTEVDNMPANALYTSINPSEIQNFIGYTYILKK